MMHVPKTVQRFWDNDMRENKVQKRVARKTRRAFGGKSNFLS